MNFRHLSHDIFTAQSELVEPKRMFGLIAAILTLSLSILDGASAAILIVPNEYGTIQAAIDAASATDTVLVQPGTYTENVSISKEITLASLTLVTGDLAYVGQTIIDGNHAGSCIDISSGPARVLGFTLQNGIGHAEGAGGAYGGGVYCNNSDIVLENLLVWNNHVSADGGGIGVNRASHAEITNVVAAFNIADRYGSGVGIWNGATATISNSTISFNGNGCNGRDGLNIYNGCVVAVVNSIISDNSHDQLYFSNNGSPSEFSISYSDVIGNGDLVVNEDGSNVAWGDGNIQSNPLFADAYHGDYRLSGGSPCIDAGDPNSPNNPDGSRADIGAYNLTGVRAGLRVLNVPCEFGTIQAAVDAAVAGDTVLVQPGTYHENVSITKDIILASLKLTTGDDDYIAQTIIDGGQHGTTVVLSYCTVTVVGFTIQNGSGTDGYNGTYGGGIFAYGSNLTCESLVVMDNFADSGGGISAAVGNLTVRNSVIAFNKACWGGGINLHHAPATLDHVTIAHNRLNFARGFSQMGGGFFIAYSGATVNNSILYDNEADQVSYWYDGNSWASITYSDIKGAGQAWGESNIDADPLWSDPVNGNFRLTQNSPCIDAGDPNSPNDRDGSRTDMGAWNLAGPRNHRFVLHVPDEYGTIQAAIDAASLGDTVLVQPGTYAENITIAKDVTVGSLTLTTGEKGYVEQTIIDGSQHGSTVAISNCSPKLSGFKIVGGTGTAWAGNTWGGGIFALSSHPILENLILQCNVADEGGGLCAYSCELTATNLLVIYNTAVWGGGINLHFTTATLTNLTIERNSIDFTRLDRQMGGGLILGASEANVVNSIIRDNDHDQITLWVENNANTVRVSYSNIRGGQERVNIPNGNGEAIWGEGNIDDYPLYVDAYTGDFRLREGSPCIDAGDPNSPNDPDGSRADMGSSGMIGSGRCENNGPVGYGVERAQPDWFETHTYAGVGYEGAQAVVQVDDGFVIAGWATAINAQYVGYYDFWLLKVDDNGDTLWTRRYGGDAADVCYDMIQTSDGGFAMVGYTQSYGAGSSDFWLVRTDSEGQELWSRSYGGEDEDAAYSLVQTDDGGFAIAGQTHSFDDGEVGGYNQDFWLVRTDANGDSLWARNYGGDITDVATKIVKTNDGGFTIAGPSNGFGMGTYAAWMIHVDAVGDSLWARRVGPQGYHNSCSALIQTADGGYALAGDAGLAGGSNGYLIRTDEHGEVLWQNYYGNPEDWDTFSSLIEMEDGGFVLAGATAPRSNGNVDCWLLRVDYLGACLWQRTHDFGPWDNANSLIRGRNGGFAYVGTVDQGYGGVIDLGFVYTGSEVEDQVRHGDISVAPDTLDFGNIQWQSSAVSRLVFTNNGSGARQIRTWIAPWGGFFYTPDSQYVIPAHSSDTVEVWGNYWVNYGPNHYEYYLNWTSDCSETRTLVLMANITVGGGGEEEPPLDVDEDSLGFGMIPPGQQAVRRLHFHNPTGDTLRLRARIGGGGGGMFACPEDSEYVIPPGGSAGVIVRFNPGGGGGGGGYQDELIWTVGGGGGTEYRIPLTGGVGGGWGSWVTTIGDGGSGGGGGLVKTPEGYAYGGSSGPSLPERKFWAGGVDSRGHPIWGRGYGGGSGKAKPFIKRRGGGYALGGEVDTIDEGGGGDWLVVLDENGDSLWSRACGCHPRHSRITGIGETPGEDLILIGDFPGDGPDGQDVFIDKVTHDGAEVWSHTYGGPGDDDAAAIIPSPDGGLVVVGTTKSPEGGDDDIWVLKLDPTGETEWSKTYGGPGDETGSSIVILPPEDGILVVGTQYNPESGLGDIILVKIAANGDSLTSRLIGGPASEVAEAAAPTLDGGIIIAATTTPPGSTIPDILLIRTDENGDSLWSQTVGGDLPDLPTAVLPNPEGGFVIAGETSSIGDGESSILLFEVNPDSGAAASITANPDSLGFGRVCIGLGAERIIRFANSGANYIRLRSYIGDGDLFHSPNQVQTISPGGEISVVISIPIRPPVGGGFWESRLVWYVTPDDPHSIPLTANLTASPVPVHFTAFTPTGIDHSVLVTEATLNSEPILAGWEIGVYTPGGVLSGAGVKLQGLPIGVAAWSDDPETEVIDGFHEGEPMIFRIWDMDADVEYPTSVTVEEGSLLWQADGVSAITLVAFQPRTMEITLRSGWNMISVNVVPQPDFWICIPGPDVEQIMEQFRDPETGQHHVLLMKDERGRFFWPHRQYNGIPYWNLQEGYQVKVDQELQGSWTGEPIPATTDVPISQGWNLIAYYPTYQLSASGPDFYVLSPILDRVILAKNRSGNFMRPIDNFSNMPPWRESQGYQVKISEDVVLNYPIERLEDSLSSVFAENAETPEGLWSAPINTGVNMSVLLSRFVGGEVNDGDVIAAIDAKGTVVGLGKVQEGRCGIAIWGDDISTVEKDGLAQGEAFALKLLIHDSGEIRALNAAKIDEGTGLTYQTDALTALTAAIAPEIPKEYSLSPNFPNPFNAVTRITFGLPEDAQVSIRVFDLAGREVATLVRGELKAGMHTASWNADGFTSGIYLLKMETPSFHTTRKITLVK